MPRRLCLAVVLLSLACNPPSRESAGGRRPPPTFNKDVAPILFERCLPCHRQGQGAPFALEEYEQARARATKISRAVETRHMPPWLPEPNDPPFVDERRLDPVSIDTIRRWADAGAPEGTAADRPVPPARVTGWQLGQPDMVATPPHAYVLEPGREDVFRNLVVKVPVERTRFVRAVEFRPGDAPVHHAVIHIDRTPASRRLDGGDGRPGFDGMGGRDAEDPAGHFLGWAPGRGPIIAPSGMAWPFEPGTDLVIELHLLPGKTAIPVQPSVGLFFDTVPPRKVPLMMKMGSKAIDIPAGARDYAIEDTIVLPVDVDVLSVYPHAHYLGKEMRVEATLPGGATRTLLHIKHWSFHWQQDYRYVTPIALPGGTSLSMRYTYDNSAGNENNPNKPPRRVMAGQRSTDEMGNLGVQVLPRSLADRAALVKAAAAHERLANLAGAEMLVRENPDNAENQRFLGGAYVDLGRIDDALPHLERALGLDPQSASVHNEMAGALLATRRFPEAVAHFRQAVVLAPDDERMHFNLGRALSAAGLAAEAAREFERAIALNPGFAAAHNELGVLLFGGGRLSQALTHLARAVELDPNSSVAESDLGGALAEAGRFDEARRHVTRALELDPDNAPARENLARLPRRR